MGISQPPPSSDDFDLYEPRYPLRGPSYGERPIYRRWWFILLVALVALGAISTVLQHFFEEVPQPLVAQLGESIETSIWVETEKVEIELTVFDSFFDTTMVAQGDRLSLMMGITDESDLEWEESPVLAVAMDITN